MIKERRLQHPKLSCSRRSDEYRMAVKKVELQGFDGANPVVQEI